MVIIFYTIHGENKRNQRIVQIFTGGNSPCKGDSGESVNYKMNNKFVFAALLSFGKSFCSKFRIPEPKYKTTLGLDNKFYRGHLKNKTKTYGRDQGLYGCFLTK